MYGFEKEEIFNIQKPFFKRQDKSQCRVVGQWVEWLIDPQVEQEQNRRKKHGEYLKPQYVLML